MLGFCSLCQGSNNTRRLHRFVSCMHFVDDWEGDSDTEWDDFFHDTKVEVDDTTAVHRSKFGIVEDGFNS